MKVHIVRRNLLAVAVAAATEDVRYWLKSVFVEISAKETRLVATDGVILAAIRMPTENDEAASVLVPIETISRIKATGSDVIVLEIENGRCSIDGIAFSPVDGRFPDYRRIIPSSVSGDAAYFDVDLMARFAKIQKILKVKGTLWVRQNGPKDAAVALLGAIPDFIGVIMPVRENEKAKAPEIPAWPQSYGK